MKVDLGNYESAEVKWGFSELTTQVNLNHSPFSFRPLEKHVSKPTLSTLAV